MRFLSSSTIALALVMSSTFGRPVITKDADGNPLESHPGSPNHSSPERSPSPSGSPKHTFSKDVVLWHDQLKKQLPPGQEPDLSHELRGGPEALKQKLAAARWKHEYKNAAPGYERGSMIANLLSDYDAKRGKKPLQFTGTPENPLWRIPKSPKRVDPPSFLDSDGRPFPTSSPKSSLKMTPTERYFMEKFGNKSPPLSPVSHYLADQYGHKFPAVSQKPSSTHASESKPLAGPSQPASTTKKPGFFTRVKNTFRGKTSGSGSTSAASNAHTSDVSHLADDATSALKKLPGHFR
ncbi:hypothetical protein IE81DRAFT_345632 [Ceraceosorus guamensis]|uniref:Uncharacterized protein n=1 Tax=Ceraceosorus guamensis TaxID=1522189 RepID=A0A316W3M4_9BASI|nr:hypothetical protein IE81DRAFT_345632 [Ceraceosorus guamensis]PWN44400.1 hypothetical protein IE81DRAFT_345632 [Ceraceosorus guamensis]